MSGGTEDIQRVIIRAKPNADHPDYFEWQTSDICFFVRDNDRQRALATARAEVERCRWTFLEYVNKSTLIEERVREQGGEVWDAYLHARKHGMFVKVFPQHFDAGKGGGSLIRPARINECFMTQVMEDAGGQRVVQDDSKQETLNADYLLGDFIFELKDLQEEALEKGTHQEKLAKLFAPYSQGRDIVSLDPSVLNKDDFRSYLDILGGPLQRHVKKASKQVKATRTLLAKPDLRGGLILLNTGFASYPHELFAEQVERYAMKDSGQFEAVISITIWMETNGFESYVFYRFSPHDSGIPEVAAMRRAFDERFKQMMTDLIRDGLAPDVERMQPRRPVGFSATGVDFNWQPPSIPLPWDKEGGGE